VSVRVEATSKSGHVHARTKPQPALQRLWCATDSLAATDMVSNKAIYTLTGPHRTRQQAKAGKQGQGCRRRWGAREYLPLGIGSGVVEDQEDTFLEISGVLVGIFNDQSPMPSVVIQNLLLHRIEVAADIFGDEASSLLFAIKGSIQPIDSAVGTHPDGSVEPQPFHQGSWQLEIDQYQRCPVFRCLQAPPPNSNLQSLSLTTHRGSKT